MAVLSIIIVAVLGVALLFWLYKKHWKIVLVVIISIPLVAVLLWFAQKTEGFAREALAKNVQQKTVVETVSQSVQIDDDLKLK